MTAEIESTQVSSDFNIDELTTGTIDGNGTFDVIMRALKEHLQGEYEAERITGTDYATAYVQAAMSALQQASGFAIAKTKLAAELALLDAQKDQLAKDAELSDEQKKLIQAQVADINKGVELKGYELNTTLPKETELLDKQISDVGVGTAIKSFQLDEMMPAELDRMAKQNTMLSKQTDDVVLGTEMKQYQLDNVMPVELANLSKQGEHTTAQTAMIGEQMNDAVASTALKTFQLDNVLPVEVANLSKQGDQITAQTSMLSKQTDEVITSTQLKEYQLSEMLPAEKSNLLAKGEGLAAQTEQTEQQTVNLVTQNEVMATKLPIETQILEANLGKTTTETVNLVKQSAIMEAQVVREVATTNKIEADTRQTDYITQTKLPSELLTAAAQRELTEAQTAQSSANTQNIAAEKANILLKGNLLTKDALLKQTDLETNQYELVTNAPIKTQLLMDEQNLKEIQADLANKELEYKQSQLLMMHEDLLLKSKQLELSEAELEYKGAQLQIANKDIEAKQQAMELSRYTTELKTPAEVALLTEQTKLYKQKGVTELAQTDASVIGSNSVTDINNDLIKEQTASFLRNANQTAAKLMIDTWTVRHNNDPDGNLETAPGLRLSDSDIGLAVGRMLAG